MLPRNPFFIGNTEKIDSDASFLALFNARAVQYIGQDDIYKTVFFRSTPGAGKSSIFRLFTPSVLRELVSSNNANYEITKAFLNQMSVIHEGRIDVLGIRTSCAGNFSIIDDVYENGKKSQVFFALLNLRIVRMALINMAEINNVSSADLNRVTFVSIPSDALACVNNDWTGAELYGWTIKEENRICRALDDIDDPGNIPLALSSLSFLALIKGDNLLFDGKSFVKHSLLMIDDLQLLTQRQRTALREDIFRQKVQIGVWIAERLSVLSEGEILGTTASESRDYIVHLVEEENKIDSGDSLVDIANRRVNILYSETMGGFPECIDSSSPSGEQVERAIKALTEHVFRRKENAELREYYYSEYGNDYDGAIFLRTVKILMDRKLANNQTSFLVQDIVRVSDLGTNESKIKSLKSAGEFYLCLENQIPYYYGISRLKSMAFNNIEQYLEFCGGLFERRIANNYMSKKKKMVVSSLEQEKIIKKVANDKWDAIRKQYANADDIYSLLTNICCLGERSRDSKLGSYGGGSYTGIGFNTKHFTPEILHRSENLRLLKALSNCVASNYLCKRMINQGESGERASVFYLNRWICSKFDLPLVYGGWKPIPLRDYSLLLDTTYAKYNVEGSSMLEAADE